MPWMWLIAGPNGSGKTTIARSDRVRQLIGDTTYLNADDVTANLQGSYALLPQKPANYAAATIVDGQVDGHIAHGAAFVVETVLSSPKYRARVRAARRAGFKIGLIFVYGSTPALNILRVHERVKEGGHAVPPATVASRWPRSIANFTWFANRADYVLLVDNSGAIAREVLEKLDGQPWPTLADPKSPPVAAALQRALSIQARFR